MADELTIQDMQDGKIDVNTLKEAANEDKVITPRLGEPFPSGPMATRLIMEQGTIDATPKATKAAMESDANLVDGDFVLVYADQTIEKNGYYQRQSDAWVYLPYNIQRQAINQIEQARQSAISVAATDATDKTAAALAESKKYTDGKPATQLLSQNLATPLHIFTDKNDNALGVIDGNAAFNADDFKTTSGGSLSAIADVVNSSDLSAYLHIFTDNNGNIVAGIKNDGTFDAIGSDGSSTLSAGIAEMRAGILTNAEMNNTGLALDARFLAKEPLNMEVLVSDYGEDDTLHQRMPSAVRVGESRIFVAYSQFSYPLQDNRDGRLVGRFVDFNLETGESTVSATYPIDGEKIGGESRHPVFLQLKNKIVLLFNDGTDTIQLESYDKCETWVNRKKINIAGSNFNYITLNACERITSGLYAGRVVLAIQSGVSSTGRAFGLFYSDDDCTTWKEGARILSADAFPFLETETNEVSMTLDASQNPVLVIRHADMTVNKRYVLFAKSFDGGQTITPLGFNPLVPTAPSVIGIKQMAPTAVDGTPKIIMSHPSSPSADRNVFRVRVSYDNCTSFISEYAPFPDEQHIGYSSILPLSNDTFVLVHEYGVSNKTQSIKVRFLNLAEII